MKKFLPKHLKSIILTFFSLIVLTNFLKAQTFTPTSFNTKVDFSTVSNPQSVALGDLDGDGKPDLAVANYGASGGDYHPISVFRNTSTIGSIDGASFAPKLNFGTGIQPFSIAIGDVDGDGKPDLVVANTVSNTVSVLLNRSTVGNIAFPNIITYSVGQNPRYVAIGDLNGDGKLEIVTVGGSNYVTILRNNSNLTTVSFSAVTYTGLPSGSFPFSVAIGDVNGDSKPDLVVANNSSSSVSIIRNTTTTGITFAAPINLTTGTQPRSVAIGDLDGDGKVDLAVALEGKNIISLFRNNFVSGTTFSASSFDFLVNYTTLSTPQSVAIGDLDKDGKPDLVVANNGSAMVSIFRNISSGGINSGSFETRADYSTGDSPKSVAIGDLDGDTYPDLAIANYNSASVSVLRNNLIPLIAPTISALPNLTKNIGDAAFIITNSTSNSTGNFTYASSNSTVANVSGNTISFVGVGTATITATQAASSGYSSGSTTFTVTVNALPATALNFDGVDDYVSTGNTVGNVGSGDFTIEMNIKTSTSSSVYLFSKRAICDNDNFISLGMGAGKVGFEISDGGSGYSGFGGNRVINDNQWHHIAVTRKSGLVTLFIDGVVDATAQNNANVSNNYIGTLGSSICNGQNTSVKYQGEMDEVRFWNRALCAGEILNNLNKELAAGQTGLLAYYKMNQGYVNSNNSSENTLIDAIGNNTGTLSNFALTGTTSNWVAGSISGTAPTFVAPVATITANGPLTFCPTGSVTLTANAGTGLTYQWTKNGVNISSATLASYTANSTGSYNVIVTQNGCTALAAAVNVTVNPLPTATITANGPLTVCPNSSVTLTANAGTDLTYQWTKDGVNIPSATLATYTANTTGSYNVIVSQNGCTALASAVTVTVQDTQNPSLVNVPINATVECNAIPSIAVVTATDNCSTGNVRSYQFPSTTIQSSLYHQYNFDGNFNDAKGTFNGTSVNNVGFNQGIIGSAASFDGTAKSINFGTTESLSGTSDFAISVWIKTSFGTPQSIVQQRDGNYIGQYMLFVGSNHSGTILTPGKVYFSVYNNQFQFEIYSNSRVDDGKWHHIVAERDGNDGRIFIDGVLDGTATGPIQALSSNIGTYVGRDVRDGSKNFNGLIDELKIFKGGNCNNTYDLERTWSVSDISGNQTAAQQILSVKDTKAPVFSLSPLDITVNSEAVPSIASVTAIDSCDPNPTVVFSQTSTQNPNVNNATHYNYSITRKWVATDNCGNQSTTQQVITVEDKTPPIFTSTQANVIVALDANNGTASLASYIGNATATDNSGSAVVITQSPAVGTSLVQNVPLTVTLTATDASGNFATQIFTVTATDQTAPVVITKNITAQLDATGSVTITPQQVNNGTTDNSGTFTLSLDKAVFDCSNIGVNLVTLTATDPSGNKATNTIPSGLIGLWDFKNANPLKDQTGNWGDLLVTGNASISNGKLDVNNGGMARTTSYTGATIGNKTLISYLSLDDLNLRAGSALTIDKINSDAFDGIIYAEGQPNRWMNGSSNALRYQVLNPGFAESKANQLIQVALTYEMQPNNQVLIKFYRNGIAYGSYTSNNFQTWSANDAEMIFGARHFLNGNQIGSLDAKIEKAMIFNRALSIAEIQQLITTVTVEDNIKPVIASKPISVTLTASGTVSITPQDVLLSGTDNCSGTITYTLSKSTFGATDAINSPVTVQLTGTDANGNFTTVPVLVTVIDPVPVVKTKNITVALDAAGKITITPQQVDNGSSSVVGLATEGGLLLDKTTFDCSNVGVNNVKLTATSTLGSTAFATAIVTVIDTIKPIVLVQNKTIQLNSAGTASITVADINNGSKDNCSIATIVLDKTTFTGSNIGANTATLTVTDVNGNVSSATAVVTVEDKIAPIFTSTQSDVIVALDANNGTASLVSYTGNATATDNSGKPVVFTQSPAVGTPLVQNVPLTVTLTAKDASGNFATQTFTVTATDQTAPVALAKNITVQLDATGNAVITPQQVDNGTTDNSGNFTLSLDKAVFGCEDITSGSGSTYIASTSVGTATRENYGPGSGFNPNTGEYWMPQWPGTTVNRLDVAGNVLGTFNSGQDKMYQLWMDLDSKTDYYTANWDNHNFTRINENGQKVWTYNLTNSQLASAISTDANYAYVIAYGADRIDVLDKATGQFQRSIGLPGSVYPAGGLVVANNHIYIVGYTGGWGNLPYSDNAIHELLIDGTYIGSISNPEDVLNVSFDGEVMWVSQNSIKNYGYKISDGNAYGGSKGTKVVLTATDPSGNKSTANAIVIVEDKIEPIVLTQNITIQLDASGNAVITPAQINNGSKDNCAIDITTYSLDKTAFDCSNVGINTVTLSVKDIHGNPASATAIVTVEDKIAPTVFTQNKTIQLSAAGAASITAGDIDNGSTDNCKIATIVLSKTAFDCSNVGANTVTLTVTDVNGNVSTKDAVVTVEDKIAPMVFTQNRTIQLNSEGLATITAADINNGSKDNCSIASVVLSKTAFDCSNVGANTVTLTVTDVNGNVSTKDAVVTVEDKIAPTVFTQNRTIQLNSEGLATITAADINNSSSDNCSIATVLLSKTAFDCSNVGPNTVTLTVTDVNGNVSTKDAVVTVEDKIAPMVLVQNRTIQLNSEGLATITAADINNGSKDNCSIASVVLSKTAFDCSNVGINTVTLTVTDVNGNVSTKDAVVTVEDKIAPTVFTQNRTIQLNSEGLATITAADINNGSKDNCSIATVVLSKTAFDCSNVGVNTVTLTVTDVNGNVSTKDAVVTVEDNIKPTIFTQNRTIQLNSEGLATISAADIDNGSKDNCSIATVVLSKTAFDCSNVGANTVTLTVTDVNGNVSTKDAVVTVEDKIAPTVFTQNRTIQLNAAGTASITAADIDNGSKDNCSIATVVLSKTAFDCSNVGPNTVTLTVTDVNGNVSTKDAVITVEDKIAPIVLTQNKTIQLNAAGAASITAADINNGSTDNCSIASIALSKTSFDCSNVGANTVTLTVTDVNGNVSTKDAVVTVEDKIAPTVFTQNRTIQLNSEGLATITAADINNGSKDNCSIASVVLSKTAFDCSNVGINTVTLTVTDVNGNVSTKDAIVTVEDKIAPTVLTQNKTIQLNAAGAASITAADIDNGSTDNCKIASVVLSKTAFTCDNVGANTVTLTVTDVNGNVSTKDAVVTVEDKIAPTVFTQNKTIQLNATGAASITAADINNGSTDNCKIATVVLSKTSFDCSNVGANTVTLTVTDVNGNKSTKDAIVTVEDNIKPTVITQNITVDLVGGRVIIVPSQIDNGSFDNCGIKTYSLSRTEFDCSSIGIQTVTLTITDKNGNVNSKTATVKVVGEITSSSIASVPTSTTYTGGVSTNLYLGYGAQSTTLQVNNMVVGGNGINPKTYTYAWSGSAVSQLSSTTSGAPVFTPTSAGYYTFNVLVTNKYGCTSAATISICVKDIREVTVDKKGVKSYTGKVFICHAPPGNIGNTNTLSISVNAVAAHLEQHSYDRLGSCSEAPCSGTSVSMSTNSVNNDGKLLSNLTLTVEPSKLIAYPNPFNHNTTVSFKVPYAESNATLDIYDVRGVRIQNLFKGSANANQDYEVKFDGSNIAAGTYFLRLSTSKEVKDFKVVMTN